jgi:hypothetical protein
VQDIPNCFIVETRFCYHFVCACLMLIVLDGHPVWKHNPLYGLFFYKTGKLTIICRATKYYFTYGLFTQNSHREEHDNLIRI